MNKKTIEDIDVSGKRVLVRCDFNVPLDENKNITDETRISGGSAHHQVPAGSQCGRHPLLASGPSQGRVQHEVFPGSRGRAPERAAGPRSEAGQGRHRSRRARSCASDMKDGEVVLLENVRFHKEEEKNDPEFAKELASLAEIYVNDAFGTAHRAHASTAGVAALSARRCRFPDRQGVGRHGQARWRTRPVPLWRSWAALRFPIRSASSPTCWRRSIP